VNCEWICEFTLKERSNSKYNHKCSISNRNVIASCNWEHGNFFWKFLGNVININLIEVSMDLFSEIWVLCFLNDGLNKIKTHSAWPSSSILPHNLHLSCMVSQKYRIVRGWWGKGKAVVSGKCCVYRGKGQCSPGLLCEWGLSADESRKELSYPSQTGGGTQEPAAGGPDHNVRGVPSRQGEWSK
jgi:hypothetical protein